jgi:hypothetical protein
VQHTFSLKINPCSDNFLTIILEGRRRMLAQSINKKESIIKEILLNIVQLYAKDVNNILHLCTCVLFLSDFSGFLKFNKMARMRMYDITWHDNYMEVNIPENKTDINRRANYVIIGKTGNTLCPIYWLKIYIFFVGLCLGSEEFVLIAIILFYKNIKSRST